MIFVKRLRSYAPISPLDVFNKSRLIRYGYHPRRNIQVLAPELSRADEKVVFIAHVTKSIKQVKIQVKDLEPRQKITLTLSTENYGRSFSSFAYYTSDDKGEVDLSKTAATGGNYLGVDDMGLFWTLHPDDALNGPSLITKDVTQPVEYTIQVFDQTAVPAQLYGECKTNPAAELTIKRYYMKPQEVERITLNTGSVRGAMFVPKCDGEYKSIFYLIGTSGGTTETQAALFASHGFAGVALPFFRYEDLPKTCDRLDMEYFEEAMAVVTSHPKVNKDNVGVMGISKGAHLAMQMSNLFPDKVKAIACNGPCRFNNAGGIWYRGQCLQPYISLPVENVYYIDKHLSSWDSSYNVTDLPEEAYAKIENTKAKYFMSWGSHDVVCHAEENASYFRDHLRGRNISHEIVTYDGAAHVIDIPYSPRMGPKYHVVYSKEYGALFNEGGRDRKSQHMAQEAHWPRLLQFFRNSL